MRDTYKQAVLSLLAAGKAPDKIISGLRATLKARGHEALLPSILRSVLRVLEARPTARTTVVLAKPEDEQRFVTAIKKTLATLGEEGASTATIVDPSIVGGFVIKGQDRIVNHSYKQKLVQLYRSLTT